MKKYWLAFLLGMCFIPAFAQNTYSGTLAATDATFNRPDEGMPPATLSAIGTSVYYDVISLDIVTAGLITFNTSSSWDNFAVLYGSGGLNTASPLTNALVANDDLSRQNSGFTYNFTSAGTYYLVVCSFKNNVMGAYTVSVSGVVVLPLKLISFTASKASNNANTIKWVSADETNLAYYQVQRSTDGNNFTDIAKGIIVAKNNIPGSVYDITDNNPNTAGYSYYRLKIIERSGLTYFSPVALVKNNNIGLSAISVFPNPASDYLNIAVKSMQYKKASVSIINSDGEIMDTKNYNFNNQSVLSVDIRKLRLGKYFIKTTINNNVSTSAFIKN